MVTTVKRRLVHIRIGRALFGSTGFWYICFRFYYIIYLFILFIYFFIVLSFLTRTETGQVLS